MGRSGVLRGSAFFRRSEPIMFPGDDDEVAAWAPVVLFQARQKVAKTGDMRAWDLAALTPARERLLGAAARLACHGLVATAAMGLAGYWSILVNTRTGSGPPVARESPLISKAPRGSRPRVE